MKHLKPFSPYLVGILVLHTLNTLSPMFSSINNNNFSFFWLFQLFFFFVFVFITLKKKIFLKFLALIWYCSKSKHLNITVFCDCQVNLGNTADLNNCLYGGRYSIFPGMGEKLIWGNLAFYGGTWYPLRNHVILSYPYKFMSCYLYFPSNLKDIEDYKRLTW